MSAPQLKITLMMAEPRVVEERTDTTPGMLFMDSSIGRVTVAIISLAGMMPLFTMTTMRGKSVCGKTDDGVRSAEKIPARHNATAMNVMEIAWCVANLPRPEEDCRRSLRCQQSWSPTFRPTDLRFGFWFCPANRKRRPSRPMSPAFNSGRVNFHPAIFAQANLHRRLRRLIAFDQRDDAFAVFIRHDAFARARRDNSCEPP